MAMSAVVIGAGASGLAALKTCMEEGFAVICFEKTDSIGGLWRFREDVTRGVASVMRSTIINSSKESSAYSDLPPPPQFANFMHNSSMIKYLEIYAEVFNLLPRIHFNTEVFEVEKAPDYSKSGKWIVHTRNFKTGGTERILTKAVLVANGHHSHPNNPSFLNMKYFLGTFIHSHGYKDFRGYENKRVLVIGIGNSGGDIAVELSRVAKQVYLSTRSGAWILNRVAKDGLPHDIVYLRRYKMFLAKILPGWFMNWAAECMVNWRCDHALYNLKPKHRIFSQHPLVNDDLPNRILSGTIVIKGDVLKFTEKGVVFKGETPKEYELDAVIMATGYKIQFPFLPKDVISVDEENQVLLYKHIFPPHLEHPTLTVIGLIQPIGAVMPISELQSRVVARVLKKEVRLPDKENMEAEIQKEISEMKKRYHKSPRHTIQVDGIPYCDELAQMIGAKPNLLHLLVTDFKLFLKILFGPFASYHYRLQGPHRWIGARDTILKIDERVRAPLQTNIERNHAVNPSRRSLVYDWITEHAFFCIFILCVLCLGFVTFLTTTRVN